MLNAQIESLEATSQLCERMAQMLHAQFNNSKQYQFCIEQYSKIEADLRKSAENISDAVKSGEDAIESRKTTLSIVRKEIFESDYLVDDDIKSPFSVELKAI